jgi:hypothetical protein
VSIDKALVIGALPGWRYRRRVSTDANGSFSFARVPAGDYKLCVQVAAFESAPADAPFVDTCVWPSGQAPVKLADGQQVAGLQLMAPKGTWLQIRVMDPEHTLPQAVSAKGPALLEPELQLILKGPDGLYHHALFESNDNAGRNYRAAIPLHTAVGLRFASSVADAFDQAGAKLKATDEIGFQPASAAELNPVTFTLHRKAP